MALGLLAVVIAACDDPNPGGSTGRYVALGDSYTAGPVIPYQSTTPSGCSRSTNNYPADAFEQIAMATYVDVSCSGATTDDFWSAQSVSGGPNPPQLDAVTSSTNVVSVGIGGNDIGFSSIVQECISLTPASTPCVEVYTANGHDQISQAIAATRPKIDAVLAEIDNRAPSAEVFVVGYPAILPMSNDGCYPDVLLLPVDVEYLRNKLVELNAMIQASATAHGDHYVDIYTPSIGHDMCHVSGNWVEGLIPLALAAPVHPNATGMDHFGDVLASAIHQYTDY